MGKKIKTEEEENNILIDKISYIVYEPFFVKEEYPKKRICLYDTSMINMDHIERQLLRKDNNSKNIPAFTVDEEGNIFEHFDPKYYNSIIKDEFIDKTTIYIGLVNLGWLSYDPKKDIFKNWYNIEIDEDQVFEQPQKEYRYWHNYTTKQVNATIKLCIYLSDLFFIKRNFSETFFPLENPKNFEGVVTRRNLSDYYFDINPSFPIKKFKTGFLKNKKS